MIKLKENNCKDGFLDKIKNLYEASFPIDERRDFQDIIKLLDDKKSPFEIIAFIEDGEFSGFLSFWKWDDMRYFVSTVLQSPADDFFAVAIPRERRC